MKNILKKIIDKKKEKIISCKKKHSINKILNNIKKVNSLNNRLLNIE